jgi:hypothetical protein
MPTDLNTQSVSDSEPRWCDSHCVEQQRLEAYHHRATPKGRRMHAPTRNEIVDDERQDKDIGAVEQVRCPAHASLADGRALRPINDPNVLKRRAIGETLKTLAQSYGVMHPTIIVPCARSRCRFSEGSAIAKALGIGRELSGGPWTAVASFSGPHGRNRDQQTDDIS